MYLMPLSWNELSSATIDEPAAAFLKGFPVANLYDANDIRRPALCRGRVTVKADVPIGSGNYNIDVGAGSCAVAQSEYYSVTEWCQAVAAALGSIDSRWRCRWLQGSTNRYRVEIFMTSGTDTLLCGTQPTGLNALVKDGGFRAQDRAAAASHVGDYPVTCGIGSGGGTFGSNGDRVTITLASAEPIDASVILGPYLSPGACPHEALALPVFGDAQDDEVIAHFDSSNIPGATLNFGDARRTDSSISGASYWYIGPAWNSDNAANHDRMEWSVESYSRQSSLRHIRTSGITGVPFFAEMQSGERFRVGFNSPGLSAGDTSSLEAIVSAAGHTGYVIVALDPTNEPNRETRLCRLTGDTGLSRQAWQGPYGRYPVSLEFEVVRMKPSRVY